MSTQSVTLGFEMQHTFHDVALQTNRALDHTFLSPELFSRVQEELTRESSFLDQIFTHPTIALETVIAKIKQVITYVFGVDFSLIGELKALERDFLRKTHPERQLELMGEVALLSRQGVDVNAALDRMKAKLPIDMQQALNADDFSTEKVKATFAAATKYTSFLERSLKKAEARGQWQIYLGLLSKVNDIDQSLEPAMTLEKVTVYWGKLPHALRASSRRISGPVIEENIPALAGVLLGRLPSNLIADCRSTFLCASSEQEKLNALKGLSEKRLSKIEFLDVDLSPVDLGIEFLELALQLTPASWGRLLESAKEINDGPFTEFSLEEQHLIFKRGILKLFDLNAQHEPIVKLVKEVLRSIELH